jgi:hypothetical protein
MGVRILVIRSIVCLSFALQDFVFQSILDIFFLNIMMYNSLRKKNNEHFFFRIMVMTRLWVRATSRSGRC